MRKKYIFSLPNILSVFRLLLSLPLGYFLLCEEHIFVLIIVFIAYCSDLLDGFIARKFDQVTEIGKIIDPLADKLFIGTAVVILIIINKIPLWFAIVIISRDILLLLGGLFASIKLKFVIPSNYVGKIAVVIIGITILGIIFDFSISIKYGLIVIATFFSFLSLIVYLINFIKIFNLQNKTKN